MQLRAAQSLITTGPVVLHYTGKKYAAPLERQLILRSILNRFPKVAEMKQKWLNAIKTNTAINTLSAVCSMHFDNFSKCVIGGKETRLLHRAVPSINVRPKFTIYQKA